MPKKLKKAKKNRKNINRTLFLFGLLVLVIFVGFLSVDKNVLISPKLFSARNLQTPIKPTYTSDKTVIATKASQLNKPSRATGSAVQIPQNFGRSVNVPILTFHYIGNNPNPKDTVRNNLSVAPDKFDEEMGFIAKNGYNTISLDTMYAALKGSASLPAKPIILTFDDGYIDFYINAFPILKKYNLHATSFIPTGLMNQGYYLSWSQISEMNASGLISFEAHSVSHPNLTAIPVDQVRYQVNQSKKDLEAHIGHPVNFFAYPYGASNQIVWNIVKEAGFIGAVGTWGGSVESEGNIFDMPRLKIPGGLPITEFAKRI